jgi:hypothetical protein
MTLIGSVTYSREAQQRSVQGSRESNITSMPNVTVIGWLEKWDILMTCLFDASPNGLGIGC